MKWFKHFSDAIYDTRLKRVIRKYGLKGYGLYFACIEMIANQLTPESPSPDLEENARDIAEMFNDDTAKVEEMLHFMIYEQKLLNVDEQSGRLVCMKLLTHLDNTLSNNPQIAMIMNNFKSIQGTNSSLKQIRSDEIRSDQNIKQNKKNEYQDECFLTFWELYDYKKCKPKAYKAFVKLSEIEKEECIKKVPEYIKSTPNKQYRKHPLTYINQRTWEDEIIEFKNQNNDISTFEGRFNFLKSKNKLYIQENNGWKTNYGTLYKPDYRVGKMSTVEEYKKQAEFYGIILQAQ